MNTRPVLDPNAGPYALSASFNADNSCFSVALESGFRIISSSNGETKHTREVGGGIGCAELLGTTKYVALVGGGKQPKFPQNKVQIFDDANEKVTTALEFKTPVQRVRMTKTHLVVVLLNTIGIYRMKIPPEKLVPDYETVNNPFGLCALGEGVLVFPGRTPGQLKFFNLATKQVSITTAHNAPLRALGVSQKGDMVATASEKGTLIRVWSYPSCTKLAELRRGVDDAAIFSLAFSPNGALLAVTSDKSTLHLFDIASASQPKPDPSKHKWGSLSLAGPLLPRQFSDTYSFTSAKFEIGDEPLGWGPQTNSATFNAAIPGVPGGRPTKGLVGWLDNQTLIVVGAGQDARWEKFAIGVDQMGKRVVYREGWRRYLDV